MAMDEALTKQVPIGETCQVEIGLAKYRSVFRGFVYPRYLIIDPPVAAGKPAIVPRDSIFIIRFLHDGLVYGFETTLIRAYTKPSQFWITEFPGKMKSTVIRKSARIKTLLPARLETETGPVTGALVDLSDGGGLFCSDNGSAKGLEKGRSGFLFATLPSGEKVTKLLSHIRNVQLKEGRTLLGLSFEARNEDSYLAIRSFYEECALAAG